MDNPTKVPVQGNERVSITPGSFILCLLLALPAAFGSSVIAKIMDSCIEGFYRGARWPHDDVYSLLTQFGTCALGGFLFVWFGSLMTRKFRSFSVWIYATLAIAAAVALADGSSIQSFAGQSAGAIISATVFWKNQT
jgi:hypothetical protein